MFFCRTLQFWGAEKEPRLDSAIFEDLNRFCWTQQNNSSDLNSQTCNTDGQIYTLTVLNGNDPTTWLQQNGDQTLTQRKINETPDGTPGPALDFDSLLNTFPGYVKTEYTYDDSGFSTDNKDDIMLSSNGTTISQQQQQQQQQSQQTQSQQIQTTQTLPSIHNQISVTNTANLNNNINAAFHNNNNNDWQMTDHNITVENGNVSSKKRNIFQIEFFIGFLHLFLSFTGNTRIITSKCFARQRLFKRCSKLYCRHSANQHNQIRR